MIISASVSCTQLGTPHARAHVNGSEEHYLRMCHNELGENPTPRMKLDSDKMFEIRLLFVY